MAKRWQLRREAASWAAAFHRRRLKSVTFIGITGSCGKTTTKELTAAALGAQLTGRRTPAGRNGLGSAATTILRTTSKDAFCVAEVATGRPGRVARTSALLRPQIGVVINVRSDHRAAFRTLDAIAAEKRALVDAIVDHGTAVLNADDPRVVAMAEGFAGRVITFGASRGSDLRASDIRSSWPDPLEFTLHAVGRTLPVQTRLYGKHWISAALAAFGVALAMGVELEVAAAGIANAEPVPGRMSPVARDGVTFICDDNKASWSTLDPMIEFLREAQATRKIAVIGTISDYSGASSPKYKRVARSALEVADEVVFVGPNASRVRKLASDSLFAYPTVQEAAEHLRVRLQEGDLVLLKGSRRSEPLRQLALARA